MPPQPVRPVAATEHPSLHSGSPDCGRGGATGRPQGVATSPQGEEGRSEKLQAGKCGYLTFKFLVPVCCNCLFHFGLPSCLGAWRGGESEKRILEGVLKCEISHLRKPGVLDAVVQDICAMLP